MIEPILRLDEDRVLIEELKLLLRNVGYAYIPTLLLVILLIWALSNDGNALSIRIWAISLLGFKLVIALHARHCLKPDFTFVQPRRLVARLMLLNGLDGLMWSGFAWVALGSSSLSGSILVIATLSGVVGSGMARLSPVLPVFIAFATTLLISVAAKVWLLHDTAYDALGIASLLYMALLMFMARNSAREIRAAINLRFENIALMAQLRVETELAGAAKHEAEQANLSKSRFLAAASHDLRQPLHALTLFATALDERSRQDETRQMSANILRCADALDTLLQSLLDISKIDAGIIEPKPVHFRLTPLLDRLRAEFAPQAVAAKLDLDIADTDLVVESDPALVERILRNLISNAIRYTRIGGIQVECRHTDRRVLIQVRDTGIGIPPEQHERVFEEFVQLGNPERDRTKGLGLGLAIVQRLGSLLGSTVTVESTPGLGSTFRFSLPAGDATRCDMDRPSAILPDTILDGSLIALVEDEADVRDAMRTLLEGWHCRIIAAEDADSLIASLDANDSRPDIIIADYRLREGRTGAEAITRLTDHFGAEIPSLIITGDTAPERLIEAQAGGRILLHKPVRPGKLRVLLQNLLRGKAQVQDPD